MKRYLPPPEIAKIAEKRTLDLLRHYASTCQDNKDSLLQLLCSAYVQGMHDMVDALDRGRKDSKCTPTKT